MKKLFYSYAFWWLVPIILVMIWLTDLYIDNRGLPDLRTSSALVLAMMLIIFGFHHRDMNSFTNLPKRFVRFSEIVFYLSVIITFCVIVHMMGSDDKFPNFFKLRTIDFMVGIFFLINLSSVISFLMLEKNIG